MGLLILLAMIVVPITEIAVFIQAGELIGLWPTIGAVILTAIVGSALLRHQGLSTLVRVQETMQTGQLPVAALFDGLCLLIAGAFLLTPGFVTDGVGLLLFMPPFRAVLKGLMAQRLRTRGDLHMHQSGNQGPFGDSRFNTTIIDGEFHEIDPENNSRGGGKDGPGPNKPLPPS